MNSRLKCVLLLASFAAPQSAQTSRQLAPTNVTVLALTSVTVIDATGRAPMPGMTVLVADGRIASILPSGQARLAPGVQVEDCSGKFLTPGLCDMHVHFSHAGDLESRLFIANGVTSVRDMGGNLVLLDWLRRRIGSEEFPGPRIFRAGPFVDGFKPVADRLVVGSAADGRDAVHYLKQLGVDFLKVHTGVPRAAYLALMAEAKAEGIAVAGHVPLSVTPIEASDAGQRTIEHMSVLTEKRATELFASGMPIQRVSEVTAAEMPAVFQALGRNGTWMDPTFVAMRESAYRYQIASQPDERRKYIAASNKKGWERAWPATQEDAKTQAIRAGLFETQLHWAAAMRREGVRFLAGTDTGIRDAYPGFSLHDELEWLAKAGFSPMEALQAATRNPAIVLDQEKSLGVVEAGKVADLVVLDANPLEDISNMKKIHGIVLGGRWLSRQTLDALLTAVEKAAGTR
jgi:imidazolonepropionase-like amidohydrolase